MREGLESIWNSSGIHLDDFSAGEVEYGVVLKDFEQFPSILDSPEGQIGTSPNPDWDFSGFLPIRIGRNPEKSPSGWGEVPICPSGLSRMLGNCSKS